MLITGLITMNIGLVIQLRMKKIELQPLPCKNRFNRIFIAAAEKISGLTSVVK